MDPNLVSVRYMVDDVDEAIAEIRWAKEQPGLNGGILLPGVSPDHPTVPALYDDCYEPLWQVCAELDVPISHDSGAGLPEYGMKPAARQP